MLVPVRTCLWFMTERGVTSLAHPFDTSNDIPQGSGIMDSPMETSYRTPCTCTYIMKVVGQPQVDAQVERGGRDGPTLRDHAGGRYE